MGVRSAATVAAAVLVQVSVASANPEPGQGFTGGFRLQSDPKIETVFGDTAQFKRYVDRFFALHAEMQKTHEDYSRNLQAVLASLGAHRAAGGGKRACPVDAVALAFSRAFRLGQAYHRLGKEIEALWVSIRDLDELGETRGLTPDYRWKVARALKLYQRVLADFREMRVSFDTQLAGELTFQGCDPQVLIAKGEELERSGAPPTAPAAPPRALATPPRRRGLKTEPAPPVMATTATFVVDNASCPSSLRVYLDGALLGEVGSGAKAAFRSLVGRHDLCLIPSTSQQQCGDPGTLRRTYIHDGWTITLRCD